jgi:hypothetical protein
VRYCGLTVAAVSLSRPSFRRKPETGEFVRGASSAEQLLLGRETNDMPTNRSAKGAHNQALMREVNERIEQIAEDAAHPEFLCECADPDCVETIPLSIAEYEAVRSSPLRFPIKPGHDDTEFERVVEGDGRYVVVEKFGKAGEIAQRLDPRSSA